MTNYQKDQGIVGNFFLLLAEKTDGKKTVSSVVLIVGGTAVMMATPEYREGGIAMLTTGLTGLFVGLTHKFTKRSRASVRDFV